MTVLSNPGPVLVLAQAAQASTRSHTDSASLDILDKT